MFKAKEQIEETLRLERKLTGERYDLRHFGLNTVDEEEDDEKPTKNHHRHFL